jgi:hypothetical protein
MIDRALLLAALSEQKEKEQKQKILMVSKLLAGKKCHREKSVTSEDPTQNY